MVCYCKLLFDHIKVAVCFLKRITNYLLKTIMTCIMTSVDLGVFLALYLCLATCRPLHDEFFLKMLVLWSHIFVLSSILKSNGIKITEIEFPTLIF